MSPISSCFSFHQLLSYIYIYLHSIIFYSLWCLLPSRNIHQGDRHSRRASAIPIHTLPPYWFKPSPSISNSFIHVLLYPIVSSYKWPLSPPTHIYFLHKLDSALVASGRACQLRVLRSSPSTCWPLFSGNTAEWPKITTCCHNTILNRTANLYAQGASAGSMSLSTRNKASFKKSNQRY